MIRVIKVDPAGNITAIVRGSVLAEHRISVSKDIMAGDTTIEQVGFETSPLMGGDCRLEMSGGEFCGNATRAFGFLHCIESYDLNSDLPLSRTDDLSVGEGKDIDKNSALTSNQTIEILVEISGASAPVRVRVNPSAREAYTDMPLPESIEDLVIDGQTYPLVHMEGIDHLIVDGKEADEECAMRLLSYLKKHVRADAYGILFLKGDHMVPLVYVADIESLVWESSCGSGTCACTWYLLKRGAVKSKENLSFTFYEPGGILNTYIDQEGDEIRHLWMGGKVDLDS